MAQKPLTVKALADAVGISTSTVRRLEQQGVIHAVRDFRGWRKFRPSEVDRLHELLGWKVLEHDDEPRATGSPKTRGR